jgi:hypothetical protein
MSENFSAEMERHKIDSWSRFYETVLAGTYIWAKLNTYICINFKFLDLGFYVPIPFWWKGTKELRWNVRYFFYILVIFYFYVEFCQNWFMKLTTESAKKITTTTGKITQYVLSDIKRIKGCLLCSLLFIVICKSCRKHSLRVLLHNFFILKHNLKLMLIFL